MTVLHPGMQLGMSLNPALLTGATAASGISVARALPDMYLRNGDPDALRKLGLPTSAAERYRGKNQIVFDRWIREHPGAQAQGYLPKSVFYRRLVKDLLRMRATPPQYDPTHVRGVERVLLDGNGLADTRQASLIWQEGHERPSQPVYNNLLNNTGRAINEANTLIDKVTIILKILYPDTVIPIQILQGALVMVLNHDPEPRDMLGWPNAAAVDVPNALGMMLFGILRAPGEKALFYEPAEAFTVLWHELGHLLNSMLNGPSPYTSLSGAINEAYADLFSLFCQQKFQNGNKPLPVPTAEGAWKKWGVGLDFLKPYRPEGSDQKRDAMIRHFVESAYEGHPLMGDDGALHMWASMNVSEIEKASPDFQEILSMDEGGVHILAAPINYAHYHMIINNGRMVEPVLMIFSVARAIAKMAGIYNMDLHSLAWLEIHAAKALFGDEQAKMVKSVWEDTMKVSGEKLNQDLPEAKLIG
ncbi:MAG: M4 family metallopeptidase [bacterium]